MTTHLRHDLELLRTSLLTGKLPRNLSWADTLELIGQIGVVEPHAHDESVFIVGTKRELFRHPHTHQLDVEDVARLRRFLREALAGPEPQEPSSLCRMVVIIDHHGAHVYREPSESAPAVEDTVRPYDPFGFHHHLVHRKEAHYKGERVPEENSFYEEIAQELRPANEIVLVGHGTGKSSAVDYLAAYLKKHHHDVARHVIATETVDLSAMTEPEIEALAKSRMTAAV